MSKKFFLFRRSDPLGPVKRFSENGKDIPILGISADQISFMTAGQGEVNITFNQAGVYEDNELFVGDSIEKTNVSISCKPGTEMRLIERIMNFVSSPSGKTVMKFDVLNEISPFENVVMSEVSDIVSKVKGQPTERVTQRISTGDVTTRFQNIIGEINFGSSDNKPFVDYNHESMYLVDGTVIGSAGGLAKWFNEGTGGTAYNISADAGAGDVTTQSAVADATAAVTGLGTPCLQFAANSRLVVPTVTVRDDYTMYFVIGDPGSGSSGEGFGVSFGDDAGETTGFSVDGSPDVFTMRHSGLTGDPFRVKTSTRTGGTEAYKFPDRSPKTGVGERQFCYPFIIRRDKNFNMYLYNFEGDLIAFVPALTLNSTTKTIEVPKESKDSRKSSSYVGDRRLIERATAETKAKEIFRKVTPLATEVKAIPKVTTGTPGRTDGNLVIEQIGSSGGNETDSFKLFLSRFGVIKRDVGDAFCSQLAQDLYELYKPTT